MYQASYYILLMLYLDLPAKNPQALVKSPHKLKLRGSYIDSIVAQLPASYESLQKYCEAQHSDPTCFKVIEYCKTKWPKQHAIKSELKPYWKLHAQLSLNNDLLLFRDRKTPYLGENSPRPSGYHQMSPQG